jgi:hypothetical protein
MKVEDISNHVVSHSLKHICEPCEEIESFHFIKTHTHTHTISMW